MFEQVKRPADCNSWESSHPKRSLTDTGEDSNEVV